MLHDVPIPNDRNTMKLFERIRIVEEWKMIFLNSLKLRNNEM